jgi:hypothetical protein
MAKLSPVFNDQTIDINGNPLNGGKIFTYVAGSSTKVATYTDAAGTIPQTNPIIINSLGYPTNGPIWIAEGTLVKFVLAPPTDTDPPTSPIKTIDNVQGVNDANVTISQWTPSGSSPTYVNANTFTLIGDQTSAFEVGRRLQFTTSLGTVYGTILTSTYTTLTTVTVQMDGSQILDSGLSSVNLSVLTTSNPSYPNFLDNILRIVNNLDRTKKIAFDASGITTGQTRTLTVQDKNGTIALVSDVQQVQGTFKNLRASSTGTNASISVSVDEIALENSSNQYQTVRSVSLTINSATTGANGLDTGTLAASTLYNMFVIWNGTTVAGLISLSATAPTLPSGYTYFARVGAIFTDGTANKYPLSFRQFGRQSHLVIAAATNVLGARLMASGVSGNVVTPTWVAVSTVSYIPPTASSILVGMFANAVSAVAILAPNNSYGPTGNTTAPPFTQINVSSGGGAPINFGWMPIESTNIYWAANNAASYLFCLGWEDNL